MTTSKNEPLSIETSFARSGTEPNSTQSQEGTQTAEQNAPADSIGLVQSNDAVEPRDKSENLLQHDNHVASKEDDTALPKKVLNPQTPSPIVLSSPIIQLQERNHSDDAAEKLAGNPEDLSCAAGENIPTKQQQQQKRDSPSHPSNILRVNTSSAPQQNASQMADMLLGAMSPRHHVHFLLQTPSSEPGHALHHYNHIDSPSVMSTTTKGESSPVSFFSMPPSPTLDLLHDELLPEVETKAATAQESFPSPRHWKQEATSVLSPNNDGSKEGTNNSTKHAANHQKQQEHRLHDRYRSYQSPGDKSSKYLTQHYQNSGDNVYIHSTLVDSESHKQNNDSDASDAARNSPGHSPQLTVQATPRTHLLSSSNNEHHESSLEYTIALFTLLISIVMISMTLLACFIDSLFILHNNKLSITTGVVLLIDLIMAIMCGLAVSKLDLNKIKRWWSQQS